VKFIHFIMDYPLNSQLFVVVIVVDVFRRFPRASLIELSDLIPVFIKQRFVIQSGDDCCDGHEFIDEGLKFLGDFIVEELLRAEVGVLLEFVY